MYCPKCGKQSEDENTFCSGCGAALTKNESQQNTTTYNAKSKLFSAHLLNIFAVVVPMIALVTSIIFDAMNNKPTDFGPGGGVTVEITPKAYLSRNLTLLCVGIGLVLFVLGIVIYVIKSPKVKLRLSCIYLVSAIADLALFVFTVLEIVIFTCGIGSIMLVPGILQIVAGAKFISGSKMYAN